jgi:hypothetical protein
VLEYPNCIKLNYQIEHYVHQCFLLRHQVIHILLIFFAYFLVILKQLKVLLQPARAGASISARVLLPHTRAKLVATWR